MKKQFFNTEQRLFHINFPRRPNLAKITEALELIRSLNSSGLENVINEKLHKG